MKYYIAGLALLFSGCSSAGSYTPVHPTDHSSEHIFAKPTIDDTIGTKKDRRWYDPDQYESAESFNVLCALYLDAQRFRIAYDSISMVAESHPLLPGRLDSASYVEAHQTALLLREHFLYAWTFRQGWPERFDSRILLNLESRARNNPVGLNPQMSEEMDALAQRISSLNSTYSGLRRAQGTTILGSSPK